MKGTKGKKIRYFLNLTLKTISPIFMETLPWQTKENVMTIATAATHENPRHDETLCDPRSVPVVKRANMRSGQRTGSFAGASFESTKSGILSSIDSCLGQFQWIGTTIVQCVPLLHIHEGLCAVETAGMYRDF